MYTHICFQNIMDGVTNTAKRAKLLKNGNYAEYNPQKDLKPFGQSGMVFVNHNPLKIKGKWKKHEREGCDLVYICGKPLFSQGGMIYWFCLGEMEFDTRDLIWLAEKHDISFKSHNSSDTAHQFILIAELFDRLLCKLKFEDIKIFVKFI